MVVVEVRLRLKLKSWPWTLAAMIPAAVSTASSASYLKRASAERRLLANFRQGKNSCLTYDCSFQSTRRIDVVDTYPQARGAVIPQTCSIRWISRSRVATDNPPGSTPLCSQESKMMPTAHISDANIGFATLRTNSGAR
ncbi:hypothetical protein T492DRAFT_922815 [Pavlovales sp. CCMP2436]|nr:hypothetical protein T492DRAFT_922815 [Pavlovales sp. CCMP2436]